MFDSWKYSKGSYLVVIFTAGIGTLILGIAFHLRHFAEVLSGVIGGMTIILGMLTAEWLRPSRQQIDQTRNSYKNLMLNFERLLYSFDKSAADQSSPENYVYWVQFEPCIDSLVWLARSTRWPQPNAKEIRMVAEDLLLRFDAMSVDATENDYMRTIEERFDLLAILPRIYRLVWSLDGEQGNEVRNRLAVYRKASPNGGLPLSWRRKSSN